MKKPPSKERIVKAKIIKAYDIVVDGMPFALSPADERLHLWRSKEAAMKRILILYPYPNTYIVPVEIHFPRPPKRAKSKT